MKIEIIKPFKLLQVGQTLNIDSEYCKILISKGLAKSLEVADISEVETIQVVAIKKPKKEKAKK